MMAYPEALATGILGSAQNLARVVHRPGPMYAQRCEAQVFIHPEGVQRAQTIKSPVTIASAQGAVTASTRAISN